MSDASSGLEDLISAVVLLPGSGEFIYETTPVYNGSSYENHHTTSVDADIIVSLDQLQAVTPNLKNVLIPIIWFGSDLRCGNCVIEPKVDQAYKVTTPLIWNVGSVTRATASVTSRVSGNPAFGGTPSDASVLAAIAEIKRRGLSVSIEPFLMMDIPAGNTLPDPWTAGTPPGQSVYPWRGRVTVSPAPGVSGSPDQTATAATQVAAFVTQFRDFVLHYANLCSISGGVDTFLLGSEMRSLTYVRADSSSSPVFPFVNALITLANDVKTILPATKVTYAADWSEFAPFQTSQFGGTGGEIFHHLDPLWMCPSIDVIASDVYWPLSDWRDGESHLDYLNGHHSIYGQDYLQGNLEGGEGYDWYYSNQTNRNSQTRSVIGDYYGDNYIWRYKDVRNWWKSTHYDRPGAVRNTIATTWMPQSKPIWFKELGCPAIEKGSNQPNVFYDPKSSESAFPYYSLGYRDDKIQREYLYAYLYYWSTDKNPISTVYHGPMLGTEGIFLYCWDARPYPQFPQDLSAWSDGTNWQFGHWLTGRLSHAENSMAKAITRPLDKIMLGPGGRVKLEWDSFFNDLQNAANGARHNGSFTMSATPTKTISDKFVTSNSHVTLQATNAAAAVLQSGSSALFIANIISGVSFDVATSSGSAAGTETFSYGVIG